MRLDGHSAPAYHSWARVAQASAARPAAFQTRPGRSSRWVGILALPRAWAAHNQPRPWIFRTSRAFLALFFISSVTGFRLASSSVWCLSLGSHFCLTFGSPHLTPVCFQRPHATPLGRSQTARHSPPVLVRFPIHVLSVLFFSLLDMLCNPLPPLPLLFHHSHHLSQPTLRSDHKHVHLGARDFFWASQTAKTLQVSCFTATCKLIDFEEHGLCCCSQRVLPSLASAGSVFFSPFPILLF